MEGKKEAPNENEAFSIRGIEAALEQLKNWSTDPTDTRKDTLGTNYDINQIDHAIAAAQHGDYKPALLILSKAISFNTKLLAAIPEQIKHLEYYKKKWEALNDDLMKQLHKK